ncbi:DUF5320 family protein [Sediminispirochaeta smaragdinae]|uniref:Cytoplasmic protein n=1 Tax=Sediminispirochaeta smaragdinae (strain DSM 11293 / JCM 15392 / SEBR 4228) TaxID=573413 RepID=E1RAB4_SEDSS|nr:DUF5320 family protein [Sediminispirochaeta smaragdinae]ADK79405.1 conserved hypothetical protein [Sediminispirochaeta smaragdinae DSM 11293]
MPGRDGRGPIGYGPQTGRGLGMCGGGYGLGSGFGRGGYGRGGCGYGAYGRGGYAYPHPVSKEEREAGLAARELALEEELKWIRSMRTEEGEGANKGAEA